MAMQIRQVHRMKYLQFRCRVSRNGFIPALAGKFEEHLVKDVVPFIEKNYRTLTGKENRAIAGLSMGGGHTQTITNNNPGMFNYIGVFSMGIMSMGRKIRMLQNLNRNGMQNLKHLKTADINYTGSDAEKMTLFIRELLL